MELLETKPSQKDIDKSEYEIARWILQEIWVNSKCVKLILEDAFWHVYISLKYQENKKYRERFEKIYKFIEEIESNIQKIINFERKYTQYFQENPIDVWTTKNIAFTLQYIKKLNNNN